MRAFGSSRDATMMGFGDIVASCLTMALSTKQQAKLSGRITSICREVGTLLVAFTPLDYSMQDRRDYLTLVGFFLLAVMLLALSVIRELRGYG